MLHRLRFLTAGESHGPALTGILDGVPAGVTLRREDFARELKRRRHGHGRSPRQQLEADVVAVEGGVRYGTTTGAPIALRIQNHEAARWADTLSAWPLEDGKSVAKKTVPRPGHADRAGMIKHDLDDVRDVLERASARETAMRVALSVVCRAILEACGVAVASHVVQIGSVRSDAAGVDVDGLKADASPVRCLDADAERRMIELIDAAAKQGETLGGSFVVVARGLPIGLGSHTQWDRRLNARLAASLSSIHSVKAVSFGDGALLAATPGTAAHDAFVVDDAGARRTSNHAGGLEGGMTNGEVVVVEVACKPLSTVPGGLPSIDTATGQGARGLVERSDVCAVPSASIVGEAMACITLCDALLEKFGGDSLAQLQKHIAASGVHAR